MRIGQLRHKEKIRNVGCGAELRPECLKAFELQKEKELYK